MRGRDGFQFEHDLLEAGARERGAQPREREPLVGTGRVACEAHRATHDDARAERPEFRLRFRAQLRDEATHQVLEFVDRAEDLGALEERTREKRLDRLHQASIARRFEVAVDRSGSRAHVRRPRRIVGIRLEVQDRTERMRVSAAAATRGEGRQPGCAVSLVDGNRRVRGAEVEADDAHR